MDLYSDTYYIKRVLNGDVDCFACLIDKYNRQVFTLMYRIIGNREDAEELAQDAFIAAFNKLEKFEGKSTFSTWLYSIAYNLAISATRKRRPPTLPIDKYRNGDDADDTDFGDDIDDTPAMVELLEIALTKLADDEKALVTLFYQDSKSIDDIASITGLSTSNVKVKLHRTRKRLHKIINELRQNDI
jgi:RNA polymerase sigma-70 factor (ECF subfamily)